MTSKGSSSLPPTDRPGRGAWDGFFVAARPTGKPTANPDIIGKSCDLAPKPSRSKRAKSGPLKHFTFEVFLVDLGVTVDTLAAAPPPSSHCSRSPNPVPAPCWFGSTVITMSKAPEVKQQAKEEVVAATNATLSGLRSLIAGGVGGVCAVVVGERLRKSAIVFNG